MPRHLLPSSVSCSAEEVRTFFQRNKDQYLALIFEKSNSFVGREVGTAAFIPHLFWSLYP